MEIKCSHEKKEIEVKVTFDDNNTNNLIDEFCLVCSDCGEELYCADVRDPNYPLYAEIFNLFLIEN